jgi:hypothetical protein
VTPPVSLVDWVFAVVAVLLLTGLMVTVFVLDEKLTRSRRKNARLTAKVIELQSIADELSDVRHTTRHAASVLDLVRGTG